MEKKLITNINGTWCNDESILTSGKKWNEDNPPYWSRVTFSIGSTIIVTGSPTKVYVCDLDGNFILL